MSNEALHYLTGFETEQLFPPGINTINEKFTPDGQVQTWPGNTFIAPLDKQSQSYQTVCTLQHIIQTSNFGKYFTWLPPESFHMTLFEGINPHQDNWPIHISHEYTRDEITLLLLENTKHLVIPKIKIKATALFGGISLRVEGFDDASNTQIHQTRDILKELTGIHHHNHHRYVLHITLGYLKQWMSTDQALALIQFSHQVFQTYQRYLANIDLNPISLCNFDNMHTFKCIHSYALSPK